MRTGELDSGPVRGKLRATFLCLHGLMALHFNTEGPMLAGRHYCIPPLDRIDLDDVLSLIDRRKFFVLHAPRQTGKTSTLLALQDLLNEGGTYRCVYANVEISRRAGKDTERATGAILDRLGERAAGLGDRFSPITRRRSKPASIAIA